MRQFIVYTLCGFFVMWFELILSALWGVTAGDTLPYFIMLAALIVLLVAAPAALFVPRIAACIGILGSAVIILWPALMLYQREVVGAAIVGAPPLISVAVAATYLWKSRSLPWLSVSRSPHIALRVAVSLIPVAVFVLCFNARFILEIIFHGP
jgi:hypothetical protein